MLRFRKSRKYYSHTTRESIIFKACLHAYQFKWECWTCADVSATGLCLQWVLNTGLLKKRLLTSQSVYSFTWYWHMHPCTQNRRLFALAVLVSSTSFPHVCWYQYTTVHPTQVLYPSQPQDLQGPQGSVLTHNAKITAKNNHSVSFNPTPKCAHSLQGTLSNTPKPHMTRSPRVPSWTSSEG